MTTLLACWNLFLSLMTAKEWNIYGLVLTAVGVILLFIFGAPFRLRPLQGDIIVTEQATVTWVDSVFSILGYLGLICVLAGALFGIAGASLG